MVLAPRSHAWYIYVHMQEYCVVGAPATTALATISRTTPKAAAVVRPLWFLKANHMACHDCSTVVHVLLAKLLFQYSMHPFASVTCDTVKQACCRLLPSIRD